MVQSNPPLFVQDGEYPARLDRTLIGGLAQPMGHSASLAPRPGVRAHFVDADSETSLRVNKPSAPNGDVTIMAGSAFVPGLNSDGLSALYLIVNPNPQPLGLPMAQTGVLQVGKVGIKVSDPSDMPASGAVEGMWEFVYVATLPIADPEPDSFLHLSTVTITGDTSATATVEDQRMFTTALGGTLQVANRDYLDESAAGAPYGTQAYAEAQDLMYIRGKNGWGPYPAVAQVNADSTSNVGITGHQGELLWNATENILYIYQGTDWIPIARKSAAVRRATATSWPVGPNEASTGVVPMLRIYVPAGAWYNLSSSKVTLWEPGGTVGKKIPNEFVLQVNSYSPQSAVTAYCSASVQAFTKSGSNYVADTTNTFWLNLDISKVPAPVYDEEGNVIPPVLNEFGNPPGYQQLYSLVDPLGQSWTTRADSKNFSELMNNLGQGIAQIQPMFKAAKAGYFEVRNLHIKVSSK